MARPKKQPEPEFTHIKIAVKNVTGDDGKKHAFGDRLDIGDDISPETAALMIEKGLAVALDGKTLEATDEEIRELQANKVRQLQKQKAEQEMAQFDQQSPETREELRETNGEPNAN